MGAVRLEEAGIQELRRELRGELLRPGDVGYDAARVLHNGMVDRKPTAIVSCAGVADVIAAIRFANEGGLPLSVRGGGHGVAGFAVADAGLMIDLSRMRGVRVDPARRIARAEGGATWGDFDHETQAFGLATTGGVARPTGIAGLTLGGGHGYLMRKYGLACDNLLSVDVVTADGRLVTASTTDNDDLFWGLRGGGGNFGVATSFEYQLHPVGQILAGLLIYPRGKARDLGRLYREVAATAPDELGSLFVLGTLPDGTPAAILLVAFNGPIADGEHLLRPLREFGPPLMDQVGPMPYLGLQSIVENFNPPGMRNYWKSTFLNELADGAVDAMVEHLARVPSPYTHVVVEHLGGAVGRVGGDATAVSARDAQFNTIIVGMWADPGDDEKNINWVRGLSGALQPFSSGSVYVNYLGDEGESRIRAAYGADTYNRLAALKARYDPTNLFRLNQNILPAAQARV